MSNLLFPANTGKINKSSLKQFFFIALPLAGAGGTLYPALAISAWWLFGTAAVTGLLSAGIKVKNFTFLQAGALILIIICLFSRPALGTAGFIYGVFMGPVVYGILELGYALTLLDEKALPPEADLQKTARALLLPALARTVLGSAIVFFVTTGSLFIVPLVDEALLSLPAGFFLLTIVLAGGLYLVYRGLVAGKR